VKRLPHFFIPTDEELLARIIPVVFGSLHASEEFEKVSQAFEEVLRGRDLMSRVLSVTE
jgi:hypothetical protein